MRTFIYTLWFLLPIFFLLVALYGKLEEMSGKEKRQNYGDFLRQGFFVLVCVGISVLIDRTVLVSIADAIAPDTIPLGFYEVILLPAVMYIGAMICGPTTSPSLKKKQQRSKRR